MNLPTAAAGASLRLRASSIDQSHHRTANDGGKGVQADGVYMLCVRDAEANRDGKLSVLLEPRDEVRRIAGHRIPQCR